MRALERGETYAPSEDADTRPIFTLSKVPDIIDSPQGARPDYIDRQYYRQAMIMAYKNDLIRLVKMDHIPITLGSFSEIHDYVDGNMLGDAEEFVSQIQYEVSKTGIFNTEDAMYTAFTLHIDLFNYMSNIVDLWIKSGQLKEIVNIDQERPRDDGGPDVRPALAGERVIDLALTEEERRSYGLALEAPGFQPRRAGSKRKRS